MEINIRQRKIKNRPDNLFNDNLIVNIKDFDFSLLKVKKLSYKEVSNLNVYHIKYIPAKTLDHIDDDKDYIYLYLDDVDGYIEESNRIKYFVFGSTDKSKEALKSYKKLWEETKKQIEVINADDPIEYRKDFMKIKFESDDDLPLGKAFNILDMIILFLKKMVNIIHRFFDVNAHISHKSVTVRKN